MGSHRILWFASLLWLGTMLHANELSTLCTSIVPLSLMCAGSWRLCRSAVPRNCCIRKVLPVLLHPEVLPLPPSQVLLPLPLLGSEFLAFIAEYLFIIVEWALLASLLLPHPA